MGRKTRIQLSKKCLNCGHTFVPTKRKDQTLCSRRCENRWNNRRMREVRRKRLRERVCLECEARFAVGFGKRNRKFCSITCSRRYRSRINASVRRARKKGVPAEIVDLTEVLERDRWKCCLCGRRTPRRLRGSKDPRAPEVDHIVPLAIGGSHTKLNMQCLCCECNGKKKIRTRGQLRLVG